jgi:DNA-binding NarL/FixJ family response regulator
MVAPLRMIIADDHMLFHQGLKSMLANLHANVSVVAEVDRVDAISPLLARVGCDVLLLDLQMDRSALAGIPAFARRARVVVLTTSQQLSEALAAIRAGARAVVFKRFAVETLMEAVRTVTDGHVWLPPALQTEVTAQLFQPRAKTLTAREQDIVRLVALGLHNDEIADRLSIGEVTVKTHINNVFRKLDVRDRVGLALYGIRLGLIGIDERAT